MNDGFRSDHETLARHAGEFDGHAEQAGRIAGDLTHTLDALGKPWGDDEVGQSFASVYSGPSEQTRTGLDAAAGHLTDMGTRLRTMAAAYRDVDTDTRHRLDKA
ncbi:WXG100 family type VII secretion target [Actinocrispum wychmicini]|uniref:Excreted virulence factor EspC (Type VII ESX diderm) n=1 Tax=Actinocrispum wychmicini TaxID=1213861 RepID=A0A4V2S8Y0_9PSEU|nr:hypothetical protein [Actinocrispum wychmicini]TCO65610.1 hypothetical protein EV192_1011402 [Actinocrispum wychmicini]